MGEKPSLDFVQVIEVMNKQPSIFLSITFLTESLQYEVPLMSSSSKMNSSIQNSLSITDVSTLNAGFRGSSKQLSENLTFCFFWCCRIQHLAVQFCYATYRIIYQLGKSNTYHFPLISVLANEKNVNCKEKENDRYIEIVSLESHVLLY